MMNRADKPIGVKTAAGVSRRLSDRLIDGESVRCGAYIGNLDAARDLTIREGTVVWANYNIVCGGRPKCVRIRVAV